MMNTFAFFLSVFLVLSSENALAQFPENGQKADVNLESASDPELVKMVEEALKEIERESPDINKDALRVWKNFNGTRDPNFTYRFWGRRLILWLKNQKKVTFSSEEEVGEVFKILWRKGLISQKAVVLLMVDSWSHLVYLEGSPSWEKRMENRTPEGGIAPANPSKPSIRERAV